MHKIPNVLAERYATAPMKAIWSAEGKVVLEREFWIAVMKAQLELGLDVPAEAIEAYERVRDQIDLESIDARERVTRHDVKARIEAFNELAGHEQVHKGMTSRDLTENVEQLQVFRSLDEVRVKAAAVVVLLGKRAEEWADIPLTARTHNVAAQPTTMGKRLAMFGEELLGALDQLQQVIDGYPVRGLKGAVGTQMDQLSLFDGDADKVAALEASVVGHLGLPVLLQNVGQVYPRSLDLRVVSVLCEVGSGVSSFAKTLRLMAGHELASEGFAKGQTGSSAMPHKMNSRSCERINGFHTILKGHVTMAAGLAGDQWNEGDVSCSVVRRVVLPDAFFALDGLLETAVTVLKQMEIYPAMVARESSYYLPFLMSTTFLMAAVKRGVGRETAHEAVKEHALAAVRALRGGEVEDNDFLARLAGDERLGIGLEELEAILLEGRANVGAARGQVARFMKQAGAAAERVPGSAGYEAGAIL
ncbi:MAG: adenylosuccinate lyase [Verrucomicrobiales bacterium]|nr:adenylosuccinate lyase [Verrucomicrobiales bacterium]